MHSVRWAVLAVLLVAGIAFGWAGTGGSAECPTGGDAAAAAADWAADDQISQPARSGSAPSAAFGESSDPEELLFQPMLFPGLGGGTMAGDCQFSDDPYSNCL